MAIGRVGWTYGQDDLISCPKQCSNLAFVSLLMFFFSPILRIFYVSSRNIHSCLPHVVRTTHHAGCGACYNISALVSGNISSLFIRTILSMYIARNMRYCVQETPRHISFMSNVMESMSDVNNLKERRPQKIYTKACSRSLRPPKPPPNISPRISDHPAW